MNFFDHKDLGNQLLQLCPKVVKHSVYRQIYWSIGVCAEFLLSQWVLTFRPGQLCQYSDWVTDWTTQLSNPSQRIFFFLIFSITSISSPWPIQLPVQRVPWFFPGDMAAGACRWQLPSGAEVNNGWSYVSAPPLCLHDMSRNSFTFILQNLLYTEVFLFQCAIPNWRHVLCVLWLLT